MSTKPLPLAYYVALLIFIFALLLPTQKILGDPDSYLHVAVGNWILSNGMIPSVDPFSFVMKGQPWVAHEWLSQVLMAAVHDLLGWYGIMLITSFAFASTLFIQYRFLSRHLETIQTVAFVIISASGLMTHLLGRPHVLVWPLMALWLSALLTASEQGRRPPWWLLLIMALWVNMHASFILGLVLFCFVALDAVLRNPKLWGSWTFFGLVSVVVCAANPYGWDVLFFPFDLKSLNFLPEIVEWASPDLREFSLLIVSLILIAFYVGLKRIQIPLVYVPLMIALIYQASNHSRYVSIAVLLLPFLLRAGSKQRQAAVKPTQEFLEVFKSMSAIWILGALTLIVVFLPFIKEYRPGHAYTPKIAVDVLVDTPLSGNGINLYEYGGYLIYRGLPVFVDGRADLYHDQHLRKYFAATASKDASEIRAVLDKFNINWSLFPKESLINNFFEQEPGWKKFHEDDLAIIYVRSDTSSPTIPSDPLSPGCSGLRSMDCLQLNSNNIREESEVSS